MVWLSRKVMKTCGEHQIVDALFIKLGCVTLFVQVCFFNNQSTVLGSENLGTYVTTTHLMCMIQNTCTSTVHIKFTSETSLTATDHQGID
jgi:hypothetical protein